MKQPRVPEYRESDGTGKYLKTLILFLKDFCFEAWKQIQTLMGKAGKLEAKAGKADTLGGKEPKYYIQPRNLLDNSDFRNPVNQRGTASPVSTQGTYTFDRWKVNAGTWEFDDYGLTRTSESGNIQQRILFRWAMNEVEHTLVTYYADGGIVTLRYGALPVGSSGEYFYLNIVPETGRKIRAIALYEGRYTADNVPPYVPKGYGTELAECQRYYRYDIRVLCGTDVGGVNRQFVYLNPPMRVSQPTVTLTQKSGDSLTSIDFFAAGDYVDVTTTGWGTAWFNVSADL